ncbi:MAG TPA: C2 family cysteine protease, partial [Myxococcota bacterium]
GEQRDGNIVIKTAPNAQVFGLDLAEVVKDRKHVGAAFADNDWIPLGKADAQGNAKIKLGGPSMRGLEGDKIRLGVQDSAGKQTMLDIRTRRGDLSDTKNADVNVARIQAQLSATGAGSVTLSSNDGGREISEPGAVLYFVNTRTRQGQQIVLDENGKLPADAKIAGVKGDSFYIAVSDGVNNKGFKDFVMAEGTQNRVQITVAAGTGGGGGNGTLHILPEPTLFHDEIDQVTHQPKYQLVKYKGDLGPVDSKLAVQGHLGDCYYPSALKTMSKHWPDVIDKAIEVAKNPDGSVIKDADGDPCYIAHFVAVDFNDPSKLTKVDVGPFTSELWARSDGSPIYMREGLWGDGDDKDHMNLRYPLLEKAFALWQGKGSYDNIGSGGLSSDVFQAFTGRIAKNVDIGDHDGPKLASLIADAEKKGLPWSLGTYPEAGSEARYQGTGYFADHSYCGVTIGKGTPNDSSGRGGSADDGPQPVTMLTLEQPWNEQIPGDLGDGVAKITPDAAAKLFQTFMTVEA